MRKFVSISCITLAALFVSLILLYPAISNQIDKENNERKIYNKTDGLIQPIIINSKVKISKVTIDSNVYIIFETGNALSTEKHN